MLSEDALLAMPWPKCTKPLQKKRLVKKVLFAPGEGLGLGDQFMLIPLLRILRNAFPHSEIVLLSRHCAFWATKEIVKLGRITIIDAPLTVILSSVQEEFNLCLCGYYPEAINVLSCLRVPGIFCSGDDLETYRVFYTEDGKISEVILNAVKTTLYEGDRFCALFEDLGLTSHVLPLELLSRGADCGKRNDLTRASHSPIKVLIHPFSAEHYKEWPLEKWFQVLVKLHCRGMSLYLSSGNSTRELNLAQSVRGTLPFVNVLSQMDVQQFLEVLSQCDIVLSGDTFIPHASGYRLWPISVAVYGPTDPLRYCPPTPRNFFVYPFIVSPEDLVSIVECLATIIISRDTSTLKTALSPAFARALHRVFVHIERLMDVEHAAPGWDELKSNIRKCEATARSAFERFLIGDASLLLRLYSALDERKTTKVLSLINQSALGRSYFMLSANRCGLVK